MQFLYSKVDGLEWDARFLFFGTSDVVFRWSLRIRGGGLILGFPVENGDRNVLKNVTKNTPTIIEPGRARICYYRGLVAPHRVLFMMHDDDLERTPLVKGKSVKCVRIQFKAYFSWRWDLETFGTDFTVQHLRKALILGLRGHKYATVDVKQSVRLAKNWIDEIRETRSEAHAAVITYSFAAAK